ncbi:HEAT repeat-containing protein 2 [Geranomyces michiganensis]|nr:HEAT repeat-containing protein 2 [Geranomyces michiganensis]
MMGGSNQAPVVAQAAAEAIALETLSSAQETQQALQRDLNILSEPTSDRASKRRALDHIKKQVFSKPGGSSDPTFYRLVFEGLHKPLLRCVADTVENCREMSCGIIVSFANSMDDVTPFLPYIVPAIAARLDQPEIVEPAEEVRLLLVQALTQLVVLAQVRFAPYVEDSVRVLQKTFCDPFPDIKKESCKLVMELSKHCARAVAFHGATVTKAIIPAMQHRHSAVRCLALRAVRDAMSVDASALDDVLEPLRQLALDKSQSVRESLYSTAGDWLLKLPDRWSLGYKILPLLLAGLSDDIPKAVTLSADYMDRIGKLYEDEWNDRVKDEMDYTTNDAADRPRVGCRHFARDNTQKIVNQMLEGMADWNVDVRIKSTQILATFIRFCEEKITGYAGVILPALYKVLATDEPAVAAQALKVAEIFSLHVEPDVYLEVLVPALASGGGGATQFRLGCLRILQALISGTPLTRLDAARVQRLTYVLQDRELMNNENTDVLAEVASVAAALTKVVATSPRSDDAAGKESCCLELFVLLAYLHSVNEDKSVPENAFLRSKCVEALDHLATVGGRDVGPQDLFATFFGIMIERLVVTEQSWTRYSPELRLLKTLTVAAGPAIGLQLDLVIPLLSRMSAKDRDIEVRETVLDIFLPLLALENTPLNSSGRLPTYGSAILEHVILTNGIWKPGRKAAALRNKTVKTFLAMLASPPAGEACIGIFNIKDLAAVWDAHLMALLISVLEDDDIAARRDTLSILENLFGCLQFDAATFKKLYPELLKRLDDAHDDIRIKTARIWPRLLTAMRAWQERIAPLRAQAGDGPITVIVTDAGQVDLSPDAKGALVELRLDDVHWTAMVKGLTIHMDDPNPELQQSVFEALESMLTLAPPVLVREHLMSVHSRHRNPRLIDALLAKLPPPG